MNRLLASGFREPIGTAWGLLTPTLQDRLRHVHIFAGGDPWFAGLQQGRPERRTFADGRTFSYAEMAFCTYPIHQTHLPANDRRTTIVLPPAFLRAYPAESRVPTVVHELGHVLHEVVGWDWVAAPVTAYARENRYEAFAEAFEAWVTRSPLAPLVDEQTRALFGAVS